MFRASSISWLATTNKQSVQQVTIFLGTALTRMIFPSLCAILTSLCMVCSLSTVAWGHDIYVDPSDTNRTNSSTCWSGLVPCSTLDLGLEGLQKFNKTTLWVAANSRAYTLTNNSTTFLYASDIAIVGMSDAVHITCSEEAGFTFLNSTNITIQGVSLKGCGTIQTSTSKNFSKSHTEFQFAWFHATLYFLLCKDVHLQNITVIDSSGMGAVFYSTVGSNAIDSSYFSDNNVTTNSSMPGGGGLYIEFSYCTPGFNDTHENINCTVSNVPDYFSQYAEYFITNSTFSKNKGSIVNSTEHTFILPQNEIHLAFGRGGGISVFFKGNAMNNTVTITNCTISNNTALWGAGLFVEYQDMTHNNQILIEDSVINYNQVMDAASESGTGGGGSRVGYIFFDKTHSHDNLVHFRNVNFYKNKAYYGGGLSFYASRENTYVATNGLIFEDCKWESNTARVGTAVDLSVWHPVPEGAPVKPSFSNCTFTRNNANYANDDSSGTFVGLGALYADSTPVVFTDYVKFSHNTQSALAAVDTGIYCDSNTIVKFHDNTGRNGGALALMGYAFIEVSENTTLHFSRNSADLKGGAIYGHSIGEHDLLSSRNCFIRYNDIYANTSEWKATFYFENNTANHVTNSIYTTSLLTCSWGGAFGSTKKATYEVFCWKTDNITRWYYTPGNCSQNIATSTATFSPRENFTEFVAVNDSHYIMKLFPGKREGLPFTTRDDINNNVTDYTVLIAQIDQTAKNVSGAIHLDKSSVYISDNSLEVHGFVKSSGTLKIETLGPRVVSILVDVSIRDCPPGMVFSSNFVGSNSLCECRPHGYNRLILCNQHSYTTQIQRGAWIGQEMVGNKSKMLVGQCPYCAAIGSSPYITLNNDLGLNEQLCMKINRTKTLCGQCMEGYGPAVNSKDFKCMKCSESDLHKNWFFYLLTEFLPITVFFFIVITFNVSVTSGPANAFVFFAQMTTTALKLDGDGSIEVDDVLAGGSAANDALCIMPYDIWNLNFFRPYLPKFCLSPYITTLQLLSTGYITALYPLILVGMFYIFTRLYSSGVRPIVFICRPLHACFVRVRRIWDIQKSIIHALATFLLLSYTKFTLVSFSLLTTTPLVDENGTDRSYRLYYDGTIEVGSKAYWPYLLPSLLVLFTFVAIPPIILIVPSVVHLVQKARCCRVPDMCGGGQWNQFLNTFHGCYKDGTGEGDDSDNKHDCRWFAGLYFILRVVLLAIYAFTYDWVVQTVLQLIVSVGALLMFVIFRPYKNDFYNKVDPLFFGCIIVLCTLSLQNYYASVVETTLPAWTFVVRYILLIVPLIYISVVVIYHLWSRNKVILKKVVHKCLRKMLRRERDTEPVQTDDAFFRDTAGRFEGRGDEGEGVAPRHSVQSGESEPLLQNEQPLPRSSGGSSGESGNRQRRSNESGSQYGAAQISAGTQTPVSDFEAPGTSFGSSGVGKFQVGPASDEKEDNSLQKKRKNLFFTH